METAARFASRHMEPAGDALVPIPPERERALRVTVTYLLSEQGRKASLLAGGDGRAVQQITVTVPAARLHLVSVDPKGVARLKLRPSFELDAQQRVIIKDTPPTYDAPPTPDDLFREAAGTHQLERAYHLERSAEKAKHREVDVDLRTEVARAFLNDRTQRAVERPTPAPTHCFLIAEGGRRLTAAAIHGRDPIRRQAAIHRGVDPHARHVRSAGPSRRWRALDGRTGAGDG